MKRTHTAKIGWNRGNARLWIEGQYLVAAGFVPGGRYSVALKRGKLVITPDDEGARTITGKKGGKSAVLDIMHTPTLGPIADAERVRVTTELGRVTVTPID